jgi:hypothetical protein
LLTNILARYCVSWILILSFENLSVVSVYMTLTICFEDDPKFHRPFPRVRYEVTTAFCLFFWRCNWLISKTKLNRTSRQCREKMKHDVIYIFVLFLLSSIELLLSFCLLYYLYQIKQYKIKIFVLCAFRISILQQLIIILPW